MTEFYMGIDIGSPAGDDDRRGDFSLPDDFTVGDVVSLIVGGPDMVVLDVCECGSIEVAWATSDGDVMRDAFPEEALVSVV